jgi:16S rRNA U1498 N3-methylase RsmE
VQQAAPDVVEKDGLTYGIPKPNPRKIKRPATNATETGTTRMIHLRIAACSNRPDKLITNITGTVPNPKTSM